MASNDDRENVTTCSFDTQGLSLGAARACLTKLLASQKPHDRQLAIEEIDKHLVIVETWMQNEGDMASTTQAEITELKILRNAALPIHTLPREILTYILLIRLDPLNWSIRVVTRFMSVCSSWKSLLENGWMFWPRLRSRYSPRLLELILSRNASGPLHVVCSKWDEEPAKSGFLKLAAKHSTRWFNLTFAGVVSNAVKEQLHAPTPNLTELNVCSSRLNVDYVTIDLSEGKTLHHLLLHGVGISWDTPRLRGLRSIQLNRVNHSPPSLSQLYTILASSPQLWYLRLSGIAQGSEAPADTQGAPSRPILLPALSTLSLRNIPEHFMSHLLTHIQAQACRCVVAADIPLSVASDLTFNNLIAPALQVSDGIRITWNGAAISISSEPRPEPKFNWISLIEETVGIDITICGGASLAGSKDGIQSLLGTVTAQAPSKLAVSFAPFFSESPIMTAPEFLRHLSSTKAIECKPQSDCQAVLQYLALEGREGSGFPCPELESLTVALRGDAEMELLRRILRARQTPYQFSSERAGSFARPLKRLYAQETVLNTLGTDGLLEGLETGCIF